MFYEAPIIDGFLYYYISYILAFFINMALLEITKNPKVMNFCFVLASILGISSCGNIGIFVAHFIYANAPDNSDPERHDIYLTMILLTIFDIFAMSLLMCPYE
jgi:hypothetical protein